MPSSVSVPRAQTGVRHEFPTGSMDESGGYGGRSNPEGNSFESRQVEPMAGEPMSGASRPFPPVYRVEVHMILEDSPVPVQDHGGYRLMTSENAKDLMSLRELVEHGKIAPAIDRLHRPRAQAPAAGQHPLIVGVRQMADVARTPPTAIPLFKRRIREALEAEGDTPWDGGVASLCVTSRFPQHGTQRNGRSVYLSVPWRGSSSVGNRIVLSR